MAGIAGYYGTLITDISTQLMADGLNDYQRQALEVERSYRQQVKAANEYAKALGLTEARVRTWPRSRSCAPSLWGSCRHRWRRTTPRS